MQTPLLTDESQVETGHQPIFGDFEFKDNKSSRKSITNNGRNGKRRISLIDKFGIDQSELTELSKQYSMRQQNTIQSRNLDDIRESIGINDNSDDDGSESDMNSPYSVSFVSSIINDNNRIPMNLSWKNITYSVKIKSTTGVCADKIDKVILNDVSGFVRSGSLVAIMGPSGSGKTTLLNVLSKRIMTKKGSKLTGQVKINGINRYKLGDKFTYLSAFVQQDDILFNQQTVFETLKTAANFSIQKGKERMRTVNDTLKELDLTHAKNTKIGDAKVRGVSGGERKRCNLGVQLIQNPSLLFLDEPTSGLDSYQALKVIETLKKLCMHGCTIITSIHQPRSSIFALFDDIILLSKGNVVYHGPSGDDALKYFAQQGLVCPPYFNPADFFLDMVSIDTRSKKAEERSRDRIINLANEYRNYYNKQIKINGIDIQKDAINQTNEYKSRKQSKYSTQLKTLAKRAFTQMIRDKTTFITRVIMNIFFAFFISAVYYKTRGSTSQESIQDRQGVLFFMCILQVMGPIMNSVQNFGLEKSIIMRERQSKSYELGIYYLTTFFSQTPIQVFFPVIFGCTLYYIVGLYPSAGAFFTFLGTTVAMNLCSIGVGFFCGAIASIEAAATIGQVLVALMILFSGFFIHVESLPLWLKWLTNLSIIHWGFQAYCINEFQNIDEFECELNFSCIKTGNDVLLRLGFNDHSIREAELFLFVLLFGFHLIAFLVLKFNKQRYMELPKKFNEYEPINHEKIMLTQLG